MKKKHFDHVEKIWLLPLSVQKNADISDSQSVAKTCSARAQEQAVKQACVAVGYPLHHFFLEDNVDATAWIILLTTRDKPKKKKAGNLFPSQNKIT